ncbi:TetR/AcrR family transcriptional regulator [Paradesertivirga mongoliensis]|uniref:TetR/AcrR family transcriptional regulator n=1 Tax=Paradesertivirga mongoliensis TaxID=2100740 RepID=A0ABW4ZQC7_9SPHI|nr:TetR/AcrR family transcriptional regulator [Pedobacter mongoliensis]
MENQDKKRELIIETAVKRFAHFGLAKTTMTDIASDLSLSKALLYYYFPDKISLYAAVLESIIREMSDSLNKSIAKIKESQKALFFYLTKRHEYILKYHNILDYIRMSGTELPVSVQTILLQARAAEQKLLSSIIQIGVDSGELQVAEVDEASALLLDALMGMRAVALQNKQPFQLQRQQFEALLVRQKQLGEIFLKGLK